MVEQISMRVARAANSKQIVIERLRRPIERGAQVQQLPFCRQRGLTSCENLVRIVSKQDVVLKYRDYFTAASESPLYSLQMCHARRNVRSWSIRIEPTGIGLWPVHYLGLPAHRTEDSTRVLLAAGKMSRRNNVGFFKWT